MKSLFIGILLIAGALSGRTDASEPQSFEIDLGGQSVRVPVPDGYVRTSQLSPEVFAIAKDYLPRGMRLEEVMGASKEYALDDPFAPPSIEVMVREGDVGRKVNAEVWADERRQLAETKVDINDHVEDAKARTENALRKLDPEFSVGNISFAPLEKISEDDPRTFRYYITAKAQPDIDGKVMDVDAARVVVIAHVGERLLYVAFESWFPPNQVRPWRVTEAADRFLADLYRMNP